MAKPSDLVGPAKWERASAGGDPLDDVQFPSEVEPEEDALLCAGLAIGEAGKDGTDELVLVYRENDRLMFADTDNAAGITLDSLTGGGSSDRAWRRHFLLMGG